MSRQLTRCGAGFLPARKIRVVLVDDSRLVLTALAGLLEKLLPLQIVGQAENGLEGFALANLQKPDLVITDLQMPYLGGFQLVERLREAHPAMRSIVTSASGATSLRAASRRHGADDFIAKERLPAELPCLLKRLFPDVVNPVSSKYKP